MVVKERAERRSARADETRSALIAAARALFGAHGYAATSLDAVVGKAGVTKGALYHHFSGKEDLFRVVFEEVKRELSARLAEVLPDPDPWTGLVAACRAYVEAHTEPSVKRIVLLDARAVLSGQEWRRVDGEWGAVMFRGAFRRAVNRGLFAPMPLNTLAMIVTGALAEACLLVADADDPELAREEALQVVVRLLGGLRVEQAAG